MITHAFVGVDPPTIQKPRSALVPTSPRTRAAETTSTSYFKRESGAAESRVTGTTRGSSPSPAHQAQTTGPRSTPRITPSPSSPSTAKTNPPILETSSQSQDTQVVETHPPSNPHIPETSSQSQDTQVAEAPSPSNGSQAPYSSNATSEIQPGCQKFQHSIPSMGEGYEEGTSALPERKRQIPVSKDGRDQNRDLSDTNSDARGRPSKSANAVFGDWTARPLTAQHVLCGTSTAGIRAQPSSLLKNVGEHNTVLPFKYGEGGVLGFGFIWFYWFALLLSLFCLWSNFQ